MYKDRRSIKKFCPYLGNSFIEEKDSHQWDRFKIDMTLQLSLILQEFTNYFN